MKKFRFIYPFVLSFLFIPLVTSCDDDPASGAGETDAPVPPSFGHMQMKSDRIAGGHDMDWSLKQVSQGAELFSRSAGSDGMKEILALQQDLDDIPPGFMASILVSLFESAFMQHVWMYQMFTMSLDPDGAAYANGEYIWDYQLQDPEIGGTLDIQLSASVTNGNVHWALLVSADFEEYQLEEQLVLEGTTSFDGNTGDWTLTIEDPVDEFVFTSSMSWEYDGENLTHLALTLEMEEGEDDFVWMVTGTYALDGTTASVNNVQINSTELDEDDFFDMVVAAEYSVEWDIETGAGIMVLDGSEICWNEEAETVDC